MTGVVFVEVCDQNITSAFGIRHATWSFIERALPSTIAGRTTAGPLNECSCELRNEPRVARRCQTTDWSERQAASQSVYNTSRCSRVVSLVPIPCVNGALHYFITANCCTVLWIVVVSIRRRAKTVGCCDAFKDFPMAVLFRPRRICSRDRGKGERLKCGVRKGTVGPLEENIDCSVGRSCIGHVFNSPDNLRNFQCQH